jgi:menaquinone-specific isochorismate synthase
VLERIRSEALRDIRAIEQTLDTLAVDKNTLLTGLTAKRVEHYLDLGTGACYLAKSEIADVVVAALQHFHERRYRLQAWCVMPNHVHILFQLFPGEKLSSVLHSWKSFTSKKCSGILGASGAFWQKEYYDHLVRNEEELRRIAQYFVENPVWLTRLAVGLGRRVPG